jgi:hypothetical protein
LATAGYVILDTLSILASKEIKMKMTRFLQQNGNGDAPADEEAEMMVSVCTAVFFFFGYCEPFSPTLSA